MRTAKFCLQIEEAGQKRSFPLQHPVSRLGHADYCEVHLNSRSPHAATVMVQSDHAAVINRTTTAINCGRHVINPGERHVWSVGQVLALEGIRVTLAGVKTRDPARQAVDAAKGEVSSPGDGGKTSRLVPSTPSDASAIASSTPRSRRQVAVIIMCGFVMTAMLMGSRTVSNAHEKKKFDDCLSKIQAAIDTNHGHAEIHSRLSSLVELIESVDGGTANQQMSVRPDARVLAFCLRLAETSDDRVTNEERHLAKRFVALLNRREEVLSAEQVRSLEQCLHQLFEMREKHRESAGVHSRMTTLAEVVYRYKSVSPQNKDVLAIQKRDAITFCRSLAEANAREVTESERQLAKSLTSLLEGGV